ncbi:MAG: magnesium transporter [Acidimicrobiia bacterium]|nr:MAG: magnesium transporter [Acidimicrobiia bacterium]
MKIRIRRPGQLSTAIRELARRRPVEAEEYLDSHQDAWEQIAGTDPHDAADILEALDEEGAADLLQDLELVDAGDVLDQMRPEAAADVLEELDPLEAAELISEMETDQAVDLIGALDRNDRTAVLSALDSETAAEVESLLIYPADTAGGMMTTDYAALPVGMTAGEAIEALRRLHAELGSNLRYVYVINDENRLIGVVPFRELVFARPNTGLEEVIETNVAMVRTDTDREEVAELIQRYTLIAIPVVDHAGTLVGMVKVSEAIEGIVAEIGEDIAVMVGAGEGETVFTPVGWSVQRRLPWITFNLIVGVVLAGVISRFEATLTMYAVLAAYMPVVSALAGNAGAQSLAVVIRSMAVGELPPGRAGRAVRREIAIGIVNGTALAVLTAIMAAITLDIFKQPGGAPISSMEIAIIVFIAVWMSFLVAGLFGAGIPILLRRMGRDPAVASNIFLTMVTDIVGMGGFLLTAALLLS